MAQAQSEEEGGVKMAVPAPTPNRNATAWWPSARTHQRPVRRARPRIEIASGSKLGLDATKKIPGEGFKRDWPPLIRMDEAVRRKIDAPCGNKP